MSTITDQILQAVSPDPSLDLRQEIRVELVSLFSMDQQYERALDVAALGWACADRLLQERDDLRRAFCYASASERGSTWRDLPLVAARNWGRAVALALYPEGKLREILDRECCYGEDQDEAVSESYGRLDAEFPA